MRAELAALEPAAAVPTSLPKRSSKAACASSTLVGSITSARLADAQSYDIILMDVQMPEMDGPEVCRRVNALPSRPRNVAIAVDAMQGDRDACLAAGMVDSVIKPIRAEALVAALQQTPGRLGS